MQERARGTPHGLAWVLAVGLCACREPAAPRGFAEVRVARYEGEERTWGLATAERFGMAVGAGAAASAGNEGPAPSPELQRDAGLRWELPAGWSVAAPRPFRVVTLASAAHPAVECGVTVLQGTGGGVEANLARWAGQLDSPAGPARTAAQGELELLGGPGRWLRLEAAPGGDEDSAMLGAVAGLEGRTLFVKLTGPAAAVRAEEPAFLAFCRSLRAEDRR